MSKYAVTTIKPMPPCHAVHKHRLVQPLAVSGLRKLSSHIREAVYELLNKA